MQALNNDYSIGPHRGKSWDEVYSKMRADNDALANAQQKYGYKGIFGATDSSNAGRGSGTSGAFGLNAGGMNGLMDTAKQWGEYTFGQNSKAWELANKYRMSEEGQRQEGETGRLGMSIAGTQRLEDTRQSGETGRLGMQISNEQRLEGMRQGGLNRRQDTQISEDKRAQLATFDNQSRQKADDAARARLLFRR